MVSVTTQISNRPAGDYTFTVTDAIGCSATATVTLNTLHGQMSPGTISGPQTLCFGDTLGQVSGTAATGDECVYQWQISTDGNTWSPATGTNNTQNYTLLTPATSNFQLRRAWIGGQCGTLYSNTLMISVWPVSSDTIHDELCEGQPYQQHGFDISGAETMGQDSLTFVEHYTSVNGCDSTVMLVLTIHALKETNLNVEICEGDGYYADGFAIQAEETVGEDTLLRILNLQTTEGCDSIIRLEAVIIDTALRIENLTADFCEDMQAELVVVTNMTDYEWSTGEHLPNITVNAPGIYMVTASQGECSVSARYVIEPCIFELYLPNAISPSREDGLNDYFSISEHAQGMINLFEISIFNRWGELVYYSNNKGFQWNGEVKGQIYHQNVYNYVIEYTDSAGRPYRVTGTITVL
jgi:gliding motility-associated-like protein